MKYYAAVFFVLAIVFAALGLSDTPVVADTLAWLGFAVFTSLAAVAAWRWRSDLHGNGYGG